MNFPQAGVIPWISVAYAVILITTFVLVPMCLLIILQRIVNVQKRQAGGHAVCRAEFLYVCSLPEPVEMKHGYITGVKIEDILHCVPIKLFTRHLTMWMISHNVIS